MIILLGMPLASLFGTLLTPTWDHLGTIWGSFWDLSGPFRQQFRSSWTSLWASEITLRASRGHLGSSWATRSQLESILVNF